MNRRRKEGNFAQYSPKRGGVRTAGLVEDIEGPKEHQTCGATSGQNKRSETRRLVDWHRDTETHTRTSPLGNPDDRRRICEHCRAHVNWAADWEVGED